MRGWEGQGNKLYELTLYSRLSIQIAINLRQISSFDLLKMSKIAKKFGQFTQASPIDLP